MFTDMKLISVEAKEVTTPRSYRVAIVDAWWLMKDGNVFKTKYPGNYLFNPDKHVVEKVFARQLKDGYSVRKLPLAFIEYRG